MACGFVTRSTLKPHKINNQHCVLFQKLMPPVSPLTESTLTPTLAWVTLMTPAKNRVMLMNAAFLRLFRKSRFSIFSTFNFQELRWGFITVVRFKYALKKLTRDQIYTRHCYIPSPFLLPTRLCIKTGTALAWAPGAVAASPSQGTPSRGVGVCRSQGVNSVNRATQAAYYHTRRKVSYKSVLFLELVTACLCAMQKLDVECRLGIAFRGGVFFMLDFLSSEIE